MTPRELITALRTGMPVSTEGGMTLLTPAACDAIRPVLAKVNALRSAPVGERASFWITGRPGNGKTQCLITLQERLRHSTGGEKHAYVHIRFDQQREIGRQAGLHIALSFPFSGVAVGAIDEARETATRLSQSFQSVSVDALAMGIDAISRAAGNPIPFATGALHTLRKAIGLTSVQHRIVRHRLRRRWPSNPSLIDFAQQWARYLMTPTLEQRTRFRDCIQSYGSESFDLLCRVLEDGGYTTLVLILDETRFDAVQGLKALWDGPIQERHPPLRLNLVFVFACPDSERQRVAEDPSLARRFCETDGWHSRLHGPQVNSNGADDLQHAFRIVEELLNHDASILRKSVSTPDRLRLRQSLASCPSLTWQTLWKRAIDLLVDG